MIGKRHQRRCRRLGEQDRKSDEIDTHAGRKRYRQGKAGSRADDDGEPRNRAEHRTDAGHGVEAVADDKTRPQPTANNKSRARSRVADRKSKRRQAHDRLHDEWRADDPRKQAGIGQHADRHIGEERTVGRDYAIVAPELPRRDRNAAQA